MATPYKKKDKDVICLAKGFNLFKLAEEVIISEKFDGMPLKFAMDESGNITGVTRKGKPTVSSVDHIKESLEKYMHPGDTVVMEVFLPGSNFKVSSGHIRRDKPMPELEGKIWDFWSKDLPRDTPYGPRISEAARVFRRKGILGDLCRPFSMIDFHFCNKHYLDRAKANIVKFSETDPKLFEGFIVRDADDLSEAGTRKHSYQKLVIEPTMDLFIVGCEEAIDKFGERTGKTGKLLVLNPFNPDSTITAIAETSCGIGSGRLTHPERASLFKRPKVQHKGLPGRPNAVWYEFTEPRIATIKYKKDPTYDAIRQGTFQHWRPEKTEESYD